MITSVSKSKLLFSSMLNGHKALVSRLKPNSETIIYKLSNDEIRSSVSNRIPTDVDYQPFRHLFLPFFGYTKSDAKYRSSCYLISIETKRFVVNTILVNFFY